MTKVEKFKKELSDSVIKNPKQKKKNEVKLLFQELINRLNTYEEKKELIHHFEHSCQRN